MKRITKNMKMIKEKHFRKNRGLFLQRLISPDKDLADRTKLFTLEELEKATDNFDARTFIGCGVFGTVYKGILSDHRVVAIKKAESFDNWKIDHFINEIVSFSQFNRKNMVRFFGCCLESEIPLTVYEFIPNGSLCYHLACLPSLSWEDRLRIAAEASGALGYLHSSTSISIVHGDVKSSNILLDHNCTVKIASFGCSMTLPPKKTNVETTVNGTYGYLDTEIMESGKLIEKSDVYSFGVVLLELLTGAKPIGFFYGNYISLPERFLLAREDEFFEILESRVREEGTKEELIKIGKLTKKCLQSRGVDRPTMKEVAGILESLRRSRKQKQKPGTEQQHACTNFLQGERTIKESDINIPVNHV